MDICTVVSCNVGHTHTLTYTPSLVFSPVRDLLLVQGWMRFRLEQLDTRLLSLDCLLTSWLEEASRLEDVLHRDVLSRDLSQVTRSLKTLSVGFEPLWFIGCPAEGAAVHMSMSTFCPWTCF